MNANRFRELRDKAGLSQLELGDRLGVTQQSVYAWERGDAMPRLTTAIALAELYNVSLDYILGRSVDPDKKEPIVDDDGLRAQAIERVQTLSDPALQRVMDFLDGLSAGQEIEADAAAERDPASQSDE